MLYERGTDCRLSSVFRDEVVEPDIGDVGAGSATSWAVALETALGSSTDSPVSARHASLPAERTAESPT